jgi:hypothetical protein
LAGPSEGSVLPTLMVDYGGDVPSLSLSIGEVDCYGLLCFKCGLAVVQFGQQGFNGRSLTDEFTESLCSPALGVSLQNVLLLFLMVS